MQSFINVRCMRVTIPRQCGFISRKFINRTIPVYATPIEAIRKVVKKVEIINKKQFDGWAPRSYEINDIGAVERQLARWTKHLPMVTPFYAMKCNPDVELLKCVLTTNSTFGIDCASSGEIETITSLLSQIPGTNQKSRSAASRIIFANPRKSAHDIMFSQMRGVTRVVTDNHDDIEALSKYHPDCEVVLRIKPRGVGSETLMRQKFGANDATIRDLLTHIHLSGLKFVGVSFHVGSRCPNPDIYLQTIRAASHVFDLARLMHEQTCLDKLSLRVLDIGGGFSAVDEYHSDRPPFEEFASVIRAALSCYFPASRNPGLTFIAEPGRFIAETFTTLMTQVQSADLKQSPKRYFINDSLYGRLNGVLNDDMVAQPKTWREVVNASKNQALEPAFVYGATCDSDTIVEHRHVPIFMSKDPMFFTNNGAYSSTTESTFNGLKTSKKLYVRTLKAEI